MSDVSAVLSLPYLMPSQAQKHVTHNEALARLDVAVQLAVVARDVDTPPTDAADGDRYLVPGGAQGEWAGHETHIAVRDLGVWRFEPPVVGWRAFVLAENRDVFFDGTDWQNGADSAETGTLGLNTSADLVNRLSVSAQATLLTHEGAGHQLKLNKATSADTASLMFQTDFSGRAEMGTAGDDGFSIKVSADGAAWTTALAFDATTGAASGAAVQASATDTTPGRLAQAQHVYGPGNLLGTVSENGGVPSGAVIERGETADGEFVRFADGTQICWSPQMTVDATVAAGAIFRSNAVTWTFPVAFSEAPALMQGRQNHSTAYWTVPGVSTTTTGQAAAFSYQSITSRAVNLIAIGCWY